MMKNWKAAMVVVIVLAVSVIESCAPQSFGEVHDAEGQLATDIELIEAYIAEKGYTEYDTLDNEIRILVLEEGSGDPIEYNDIVSFHYLGRFLNDTLFDTSIKNLALEQDKATAMDTTFQKNTDGTYKLDNEGNRIIERIIYRPGYRAIYSTTRNYAPFVATHTPGGWYTYQIYSTGYISGFASCIANMLEKANFGGSVLALVPSGLAYGPRGDDGIPPNTVLTFEFRPISKR